MHLPQALPNDVAVPFGNLLSRLDRLENRLDAWLYARRKVTTRPVTEALDTSEQPTEPLDAGVIRTVARPLPR